MPNIEYHGQSAILERNLSMHQLAKSPTSATAAATDLERLRRERKKANEQQDETDALLLAGPTRRSGSSSSLLSGAPQQQYYSYTPPPAASVIPNNPTCPSPLLSPSASPSTSTFIPPIIHHRQQQQKGTMLGPSSSAYAPSQYGNYDSCNGDDIDTIRFQVVVWNVGAPDVVQGRVPMTFRVTLFWNDTSPFESPDDENCEEVEEEAETAAEDSAASGALIGSSGSSVMSTRSTGSASRRNRSNSCNNEHQVWEMRGRRTAVPTTSSSNSSTRKSALSRRSSSMSLALQQKDSTAGEEAGGDTVEDNYMHRSVDVPPVSLLNVVTFETVGPPEIALLRQSSGLWRWTCMYRATLIQDHWRVDSFPHDDHNIVLKLAVLSGRGPGKRWDSQHWRLALATPDDSQGSTRIPHGLIANDQLNIPEFCYDKRQGLKFEFHPLGYGPGGMGGGGDISNNNAIPTTSLGSSSSSTGFHHHHRMRQEQCLHVGLSVQRESYYYDRNIVPLLATLNFVAISVTSLGPTQFFERALLTLNIAFVEISIRMTTDKHLPSVSYPIKLQRVLNEYFFGLLFLVLESNLVYQLSTGDWWWTTSTGLSNQTGLIDTAAAFSVFLHNAWTLYWYYADRKPSIK